MTDKIEHLAQPSGEGRTSGEGAPVHIDRERMDKALAGPHYRLPPGLTTEQIDAFITNVATAYRAGMERAAEIAENCEAGDGSHDYNAGAETMSERIAAAIRVGLEKTKG